MPKLQPPCPPHSAAPATPSSSLGNSLLLSPHTLILCTEYSLFSYLKSKPEYETPLWPGYGTLETLGQPWWGYKNGSTPVEQRQFLTKLSTVRP